MSVYVIWRTSRPTGGLGEAMQRIAIQVASEGEYTSVEILSTPKTTSGGRSTAPNFKVRLHGVDEGREVQQEHIVRIEHRNASGHTRRYQMNNRDPRYNYSTLRAKGHGPSNSPKNKRLRREQEAAQSAQRTANSRQRPSHHSATSSTQQRAPAANYGGGSGSRHASGSGGSYGDSRSTTGQTPDGWYPDPSAPGSGKLRWFAGGSWTSHTH